MPLASDEPRPRRGKASGFFSYGSAFAARMLAMMPRRPIEWFEPELLGLIDARAVTS
jgi:hypothetical protein